MKKLSILIFALSELYPCVVYASSNDEIPFLFNVSLDANNNTPISLDEIIELMKQRFDTIKNFL